MKEIEITLLVIQWTLFLVLNRIATKAKGTIASLGNLIQYYFRSKGKYKLKNKRLNYPVESKGRIRN